MRLAYRGSDAAADPIGVSVFRISELRPMLMPSLLRGRWCSNARPHLPHVCMSRGPSVPTGSSDGLVYEAFQGFT